MSRAETDRETGHRYTPAMAGEIERRWQDEWDRRGTYRTPNPGDPGFDAGRPKYYVLDMFPYPSGSGLHVGHPEGYTATDIIGRYKRMRGFNVLHPMGWDAFGLPAEQYAIQTGVHPAVTTRRAIDTFRRQLRRFGFGYDWSREFGTIDESYYGFTQWIFLQLYESWFDPEAGGEFASDDGPPRARGRARPIRELVEAFASGARPVRLNPDAAEHTDAERAEALPAWHTLDDHARHRVVNSWRLAYLGEQTVNWCPKLGTALANEEVVDGVSERGGHPVFRKPLRQWMLRITAYAERLLEDLPLLDWPESTRTQQAEWIGRSVGAEVRFPLADPPAGAPADLLVYTTRPDTIFGATYMVVAPEHPLVDAVLARRDDPAVRAYAVAARNRSDVERQESKEKTGVPLGLDAVNPATGARIPVWVADYVLWGYGTGAIMAVPAQDERDWAFAAAFGLPIVRTVRPPEGWEGEAWTGDGPAINSANAEVSLDGLGVDEAKARITAWLEGRGLGRRKVNYRLRDWLFSRQRYWGEPFPIVFTEDGRHWPVGTGAASAHLPVVLPPLDDYQPEATEDPTPLLAKARGWAETTAGQAGVDWSILDPGTPVRRETNTMPGWAGSCWYYLRYCDPGNRGRFVGRDAERYWMLGPRDGVSRQAADEHGTFEPHLHRLGGVDLYVGGAEHAVLHLLYARFWHKVLFDLHEVSTPEPFNKLFHQGLITAHSFQAVVDGQKRLVPVDEIVRVVETPDGVAYTDANGEPLADVRDDEPPAPGDGGPNWFETREGHRAFAFHRPSRSHATPVIAKMSKSLRNVVNPDDVIERFGADTFRLYEMYMGPLEQNKPWNTDDTIGMFRFLADLWKLCVDEATGLVRLADEPDPGVEKLLHRTIAKVGADIERLAFNTAIAAMIQLKNAARAAERDRGGSPVLTADQLDRLARTLAPFCPHLAEELWCRLGRIGLDGRAGESIALAPWPDHDPAMLVDDEVEVPVQILGKVRSRITVPADADEAAMERIALADDRVRALLDGKTVRKVIVVKGRMVNIIV